MFIYNNKLWKFALWVRYTEPGTEVQEMYGATKCAWSHAMMHLPAPQAVGSPAVARGALFPTNLESTQESEEVRPTTP